LEKVKQVAFKGNLLEFGAYVVSPNAREGLPEVEEKIV